MTEAARGASRRVLPGASIEIARRIAGRDDLPLDVCRRYHAYLGSYVEDKWGEPDGYFFRHRDGGRNENMMIVNANDRLLRVYEKAKPEEEKQWIERRLERIAGAHP